MKTRFPGGFDLGVGFLRNPITINEKSADFSALKVVGVERFELSGRSWEDVAAQFCKWLGLCGGVAGDAQTEAAKLAVDVLARVEGGLS